MLNQLLILWLLYQFISNITSKFDIADSSVGYVAGPTVGVWGVRYGSRAQGTPRPSPGDALGRATLPLSRVPQDLQAQRASVAPPGHPLRPEDGALPRVRQDLLPQGSLAQARGEPPQQAQQSGGRQHSLDGQPPLGHVQEPGTTDLHICRRNHTDAWDLRPLRQN